MAINGFGRPCLYIGTVKQHMLDLIRKFNISQAMDILNAVPGTELALERDLGIVPAPLGVSYPTLLKFAKEAGIKKKRGLPVGTTPDGSRAEERERCCRRRRGKFQVI
jgi:hypothetical protein